MKEVKRELGLDTIELKPHCFKEYLKALGFRLVHSISQTDDEQKLEKVIYVYARV